MSDKGRGKGRRLVRSWPQHLPALRAGRMVRGRGEAPTEGEVHEIRFADDAILCFHYREDAEKVKDVLSKRFAKYGLTLHPEKTRLLEFGRYAEERAKRQDKKKSKVPGFRFAMPARTRRVRLEEPAAENLHGGVCEGGDISRGALVDLKRARSWKRRTQPRKTYSLSGLLYSERWRFNNNNRYFAVVTYGITSRCGLSY